MRFGGYFDSSRLNSTVKWLPPACGPEVFRTTSSDTTARHGDAHRGFPACGPFKWSHRLAFAFEKLCELPYASVSWPDTLQRYSKPT